jgi:NADH:ubiquinone oxidoreductase subunit F (NADH-binding)
MGGAGFRPAASGDRPRPGRPDQYVVCNADEAEPGTFKDRQILAEQPHLVVEGMLIAMRTVGAQQGWVFIRHEYEPEERLLRESSTAPAPPACSTTSRSTFTSPGGYILGEETALLECMEGHRGEPRNKPPFPGGYGLHGRPTLMNNVETFASVPIIPRARRAVVEGPGRQRRLGAEVLLRLRPRRAAWRVLRARRHAHLRSDRPRRRRARRRGRRRRAAWRGIDQLPRPRLRRPAADVRRDREAARRSAPGRWSLAEGTDLLAAATNILNFFRNESCGKCVPCRVGSHKAHKILVEVLERGARSRTWTSASTSWRRPCG